MKTLLATVGLGLLLTSSVGAQGQSNQAKYEAKLQEEFASKIEWTQSLEEAQLQAKEKQMLIFGYFSRSYAP